MLTRHHSRCLLVLEFILISVAQTSFAQHYTTLLFSLVPNRQMVVMPVSLREHIAYQNAVGEQLNQQRIYLFQELQTLEAAEQRYSGKQPFKELIFHHQPTINSYPDPTRPIAALGTDAPLFRAQMTAANRAYKQFWQTIWAIKAYHEQVVTGQKTPDASSVLALTAQARTQLAAFEKTWLALESKQQQWTETLTARSKAFQKFNLYVANLQADKAQALRLNSLFKTAKNAVELQAVLDAWGPQLNAHYRAPSSVLKEADLFADYTRFYDSAERFRQKLTDLLVRLRTQPMSTGKQVELTVACNAVIETYNAFVAR